MKSEKQSADAILDTSLTSQANISKFAFQNQLVPLQYGDEDDAQGAARRVPEGAREGLRKVGVKR